MLKEIIERLESIPATIISGVFLLLDLIPHLLKEFSGLQLHLSWGFLSPSLVTVIISGLPLLYAALHKLIFNRGISKISSALLITVAMLAAISIGDMFAAGEVAFIMALGEILEELTTGRAKRGLKKLLTLAPKRAHIIRDGGEIEVDASEISVGDVLRVLPGEAFPCDGVILSGDTTVDQSILTGESLPVDKVEGDEVFCGTVNCFGSVEIQAKRVGDDSSLQRLIRMVREAENKKAPMARIADLWASILVPVAGLVAIAVGLISGDIIRAVTVLVVFCPCALVLATPTAIMAAIGHATRHGIIIKSGEALEIMGRIDTVAFDKTGTLTEGRLTVSNVIPLDENTPESELLSLAASVENHSEHPLARAIVAKANELKLSIFSVENFKMTAGRGVEAKISDSSVSCGNDSFLGSNGVDISAAEAQLGTLRRDGKAIVLVSRDKKLIGIIALSDVLRRDCEKIVSDLRKLETDSVLLTGDNRNAAEYFSKKIGIEKVFSDLLPEDKVTRLESLKSEGHTVCMIGDGVNDAPALKTANIGVAIAGMGSDIAIEAADVALMQDNISKIPYLKRLSNVAVRTIKIGITLSMLINIAAVALSALGLLTPTTGALVHNLGSVVVVLFAANLYNRKI